MEEPKEGTGENVGKNTKKRADEQPDRNNAGLDEGRQANGDTPATTADTATQNVLSIGEIVDVLHQRIAQRKADGTYPEDIDEKLEEHFRRVAFHRSGQSRNESLAAVRERIADVQSRASVRHPEFTTASSFPGGDKARRAVINVVEPGILRLREDTEHFMTAVCDALQAIDEALRDDKTHTHADLVGYVDSLAERVNARERRSAAAGAASGAETSGCGGNCACGGALIDERESK